MKVWTVILAGVLLAALPNLGNCALEDAGVYISISYAEFEKRVIPANTFWISSNNYNEYEWFQINKFEQLLLDFENGNNNMKAKFRLGTPAILTALVGDGHFSQANYCKYLPKAFHDANDLRNEKAAKMMMSSPWEYYAVKINDTERSTITKGFDYLVNAVKNYFHDYAPKTYILLIVEKTAEGIIYVGAMPGSY